MNNKVELLAPAGNFEALTGAVMAGADAVYLGGQLFGARAYADNFSEDDICRGIRFAHLYGRKIYLTVNTLIKEKEFGSLYQYILPYYIAGLDGVIIQDLGVFKFLKKHFPGLALHISTQMTVTGSYGAEFVRQEGAVRLVPARELSLEEIKIIKQTVPIEIETFIHGALCYCYSGQCLFSSILGGRSGNRGRCAQPCRLPYETGEGKLGADVYPLSMKDLCTLSMLPELIEAGIDSFKIEGRMKKPEYAAGVTAMYRKYIDLYYENPQSYQVEEKDLKILKGLYIRSAIGEGYYHTSNGPEMLSMSSPGYSGSDQHLLDEIRKLLIECKPPIPVKAYAEFNKCNPARLTLTYGELSVSVEGEAVQPAMKQPLSEDKIKEQIFKSGNSNLKIEEIIVKMEQDIFMPVSSLNRLRRDAVEEMENTIIESKGLIWQRNDPADIRCKSIPYVSSGHISGQINRHVNFHVMVSNKEQLSVVLKTGAGRIYLDRLIPDSQEINELIRYKQETHTEVFLVMPYIIRKKDESYLEKFYELLSLSVFDGVMVRNLEEINFLNKKNNQKKLVLDANLYIFNMEAYSFWKDRADEAYLPYECNGMEWEELLNKSEGGNMVLSLAVYGRIPMMISAGCLRKTATGCRKDSKAMALTDRYGKKFPVYTDCSRCYNIIYNSVPLSLHKLFKDKKCKVLNRRIDFTVETGKETEAILNYFKDISVNYREPDYKEYTAGHYKRGVE